MTALLIIAALVGWALYEAVTAKEGYEDSSGFRTGDARFMGR